MTLTGLSRTSRSMTKASFKGLGKVMVPLMAGLGLHQVGSSARQGMRAVQKTRFQGGVVGPTGLRSTTIPGMTPR